MKISDLKYVPTRCLLQELSWRFEKFAFVGANFGQESDFQKPKKPRKEELKNGKTDSHQDRED